MSDPTESQAPDAPRASGEASPPDASRQQSRGGRGNVARQTRSDRVLLKRILAGVALTGVTELALGRRLYFAWEGLRRAMKWLEEPGTQAATEQQRTARPSRPPPDLPTAQEAIEEVVQEVIDWGQRTVERHKPTLGRARQRMRERLEQPSIGAAAIAGATLGAVASVGLLPAAVGAGTAYLVHRKLRSMSSSTSSRRPAPRRT